MSPLRTAAHHLRFTARPWLHQQLVEIQRNTRRARFVSIAAALVASCLYFFALHDLRRSSDALGARVVVHVATREILPGDTITAAMVRGTEHPAAFLAPTVLTHAPLGKVARQQMLPGELFTTTNVHESHTNHVPHGWRVVAITARSTLPPLQAGMRVDVIARAEVLVTDAIVVSVGDAGRSAMIAVPTAHAAVVATEAALGEATLAGSG